MTDQASVEKLLDRIEGLPVLPVVAVKLLEITEDELTSSKDVANLIESDPALTAKTLKMANSPVYRKSGDIGTIPDAVRFIGFNAVKSTVAVYRKSGDIGTIPDAVRFIGFNAVKSTVLTLSVMGLFDTKRDGNNFDPDAFWLHSLACGVCCRDLSTQTRSGSSFVEEFVRVRHASRRGQDSPVPVPARGVGAGDSGCRQEQDERGRSREDRIGRGPCVRGQRASKALEDPRTHL